ncbi:MAG: Hsp20/alpha crystallin family protein [Magnetococcales bacterium]|nr:Hsp20/alpha crystallin family protein [Magnetococcales bacterium]
MSLMTYDPFRNARMLQNEINRFFERDVEGHNSMTAEWALRVDIQEDKDHVTIRADLPGIEQKDIALNVEHGRLTISGERKFDEGKTPENFHRVERPYGRFSRTFQLPDTTDLDGIQASSRNGVLTVTLPKVEKAKPRAIQVAFDA